MSSIQPDPKAQAADCKGTGMPQPDEERSLKAPFQIITFVFETQTSDTSMQSAPNEACMAENVDSTKKDTPFTVEKLLEIAVKIVTEINGRYEPVKTFHKFNFLMETKQQEIYTYLNQLSHEPIPEVGSPREQAIKTLFSNIASVVLKENLIVNPDYLRAIFRFFRIVIVLYLPDNLLSYQLVDVVDEIFNVKASLYRVLTSFESPEIARQQEAVQKFQREQSERDKVPQLSAFEARKTFVTWLNEETERVIQEEHSKKDQAWRAALKQGDYIDAIGVFHLVNAQSGNDKKLKAWCPAKIVLEDKDYFLVSFLGNSRKQDVKVGRMDNTIVPFRTYSNDFDWRFDLKEDDEFDCYDDYGVWYISTCLRIKETDEKDCEGESVKRILIGCRFQDPNGSKEDNRGRKVTGWTLDKFDIEVCLASPNIKRRDSMTTHYLNVGKNFISYECDVNDASDIVYNCKKLVRYAEHRKEHFGNLKCIAHFLNEFGDRQGFTRFEEAFEQISSKKVTVSLQHVHQLVKFLRRTLPLWHREFHAQYIKTIHVAVAKALLSENITSLFQKLSSGDQLNALVGEYHNLLKRQFTAEKCNQIIATLNAQIGSVLLQSENLEKRIQGIKLITDQIRQSKFKISTALIEDFIKLNVFKNVFQANKFHLQIGQRATELVRAFAQDQKLGAAEVDLLWETAQSDETARNEIVQIVIDCASETQDEVLELFMQKIRDMTPSSVRNLDVDFVSSLGTSSHHKSRARQTAAAVLWEISLQERKGYSAPTVLQASKRLTESLSCFERDTKEFYICQCIEKLSKPSPNSVTAIKVFQKILSSLPVYGDRTLQQSYAGKASFIKDLVEHQNLVGLILADLNEYRARVNNISSLKKKQVASFFAENVEPLIMQEEGSTHKENVMTRLDMISFVLVQCNGEIKLSDTEIQAIWELLLGPLAFPDDSLLFFTWFKTILDSSVEIVKPQQLASFFETYIETHADTVLRNLSVDCFLCVQNMFLKINEGLNWLNIIEKQKMIEDCYPGLAAKDESNGRKKQKVEIRVHVPPKQLRGIGLIWKMFQASDRHHDPNLKDKIIQFLALVNQSCSRLLQNQKKEIYMNFTQECLATVDHVLHDSKETESEKNALVKNTITMLQTFFEDSERSGTANIRPHSNLVEKAALIEQIIITDLFQQREGCPKHLVLTVETSMTLWELIDYVARKLNRSPLKILFKRDVKKIELSAYDHHKSLGELGFESNEEISVRQNNFSQKRVSLINYQTGMLVREAEDIFGSWFEKYSIAAADLPQFDPELHKEERYMTKDSCLDFTAAAVAKKNKPQAKESVSGQQQYAQLEKNIKYIFETFDSDHDDLLTKDNFLKFYRHKSYENVDAVWQNLHSNDIGPGLQYEPKEEVDYRTDLNVTRDQSELPRSLISANREQLEMLFNLETLFQDDRVKEYIWQLICSLKTNPEMYLQLLQNDPTVYEEVFGNPETTSTFKMLYALQIMQNFVLDYCQKQRNKGQVNFASLYFVDKTQKYYDPSETADIDSKGYTDTNSSSLRYKKRAGVDEEVLRGQVKALETDQQAGSNWNQAKTDSPGGAAVVEYQPAQRDLSYNQKQLQNWRGKVEREELDFCILRGENLNGEDKLDALKENWFVTFLSGGGLTLLVRLFTFLVAKNHNRSAKETLQTTAERECLKLVVQLTQVVLVSSLTAHYPQPEEASKFSIFDSDMKPYADFTPKEKLQNAMIQTQAVLKDQFKPLINLLAAKQVGKEQIDSFDFPAFQELLLTIFTAVLKKGLLIQKSDETIAGEGVHLWVSCVIFRPSLLNPVLSSVSHPFTVTLCDQGLFSDNEKMRSLFKEVLLFVCLCENYSDAPRQPILYFLEVLLGKLGQIKSVPNRTTKHYFELLLKLVKTYSSLQKKQPELYQKAFDPLELTAQGLNLLNEYQSCETKASVYGDNTLIGTLNFVRSMLKNYPNILNAQQCSQVLTVLVKRCLFMQLNAESRKYEGHITQGVDLSTFNQSQINKCQTTASREAAYKLLQQAISSNSDPSIIEHLVTDFCAPLILSFRKSKETSYNPSECNRAASNFAGIRNLGSICYMNSMIQQFYNVPAFRYSLLAAHDNLAEKLVEFDGRQVDDNNLHQWQNMFSFLALTDRQAYNPIDFCFSFKQPDGRPCNVREQQDAQEFLNVGFERLETALKGTPQKYLCQDVFGGKTTSLTVCKECGNIVQTEEDFYYLTLQVKNKKTVYESLQSMTAGESISNYTCSACEKKVDIEKKIAIKQLPNTLILHLDRVIFDFDQMRNVKLNDRMEFPNKLVMKDYMLDEILEQLQKQQQNKAQKRDDEDCKEVENEDKIDTASTKKEIPSAESMHVDQEDHRELEDSRAWEYKLVGVGIHMGVAGSGHYLSYINIERENNPDDSDWSRTETQTWLEFNDSSVQRFDFSNLEYKAFGEKAAFDSEKAAAQQSHNAYMLVYEKREKSSLQVVLPKHLIDFIQGLPVEVAQLLSNQVQTALGCESTAVSRENEDLTLELPEVSLLPQIQQAIQTLPNCFFVYPNLVQRVFADKEAVNKAVIYDERTKEFLVRVPFESVRRFVPAAQYAKVYEDNCLLLTEKQVFCNPFFKTIASLLTQYLKIVDIRQVDQETKYLQVYQILDKLVFEVLIRGTQLNQLEELTTLFFEVLKRCPSCIDRLVSDRILFVEKKEGSKDENPFFDMLVFHKDAEVRQMAESLLGSVVSCLFDDLERFEVQNKDDFGNQLVEEPDFIKSQREKLDQIFNSVLALMPMEAQKAWMKLEQYFSFFYNAIKDRQRNRIEYFYRQNVCAKLIDLCTRFNSQNNYVTQQPPLHKLVLTVSILARAQPMHVYLYKIRCDLQPSPQEIAAEMSNYQTPQNLIGASPFYQEPISQIQRAPLFMNGEDVRSLMVEDKRLKLFYGICLRFNCESAEISKLIGHLAWHNYEFTRRISKVLLVGLNKINEQELIPFLDCLEVFLSIEDEFQEIRIEWLLGIADLKMNRTQAQIQRQDWSLQHQQLGATRIKQVTDSIYSFKTFLFKEQNDVRECVLQMLYEYRVEKYPKAAITIMEGLIRLIAHENPNRAVLKYLLCIEGPAYTCRRYWDWIEPFYIDHVQESSEKTHIQAYRQSVETSLKILSNIEKIKLENAALISEDTSLLNAGVCGRFVPEPYIMWDIISKQQADIRVLTRNQVHVVIEELVVEVTPSKPTGRSNDTLTSVTQGLNSRVVRAQNAPKPAFNPTYLDQSAGPASTTQGRGRRAKQPYQSKPEGKENVATTFVDYQMKTGEAEYESDERDDLDVNDRAETADGMVQDYENPQWQPEGGEQEPKKGEFFVQPEDGEDQNMRGDGDNWQQDILENIGSDEDFYPKLVDQEAGAKTPPSSSQGAVKNTFKLNVESMDDNTKGPTINNYFRTSNEEAKVTTKWQPEDEEMLIDSGAPAQDDGIDVDDLRQELVTVLIFTLRNFSREHVQKISVHYNPQKRHMINFRIPVAPIQQVVSCTHDMVVMHFTKLKPMGSWGNANDFMVLVDNCDEHGNKVDPLAANWLHLREQRYLILESEKKEASLAPESTNTLADENPYLPIGDHGDSGVISCPACTYSNPASAAQCEICETYLS